MNENSERARSRSPTRRRPGFRWKEKRRDDNYRPGDDDRRLERGYRDRSDRARSPRRERDTDRYGDRDRYRGRDSDRDRDRRRPSSRDRRTRPTDDEMYENDERRERRQEKKEKKEKRAAAVAQASEPMIVVHVNDRLGTKAAIPCLASDPISLSSLSFIDLQVLQGTTSNVIQSFSRHRWLHVSGANRMRSNSNARANVHSRTSLH